MFFESSCDAIKNMVFMGKDMGTDPLFAPFDCKVVGIREKNGEVFIQSVELVLFANGIVDYMHMTFIHAERFRVKAGQTLKQGQHFYDEGNKGNSTGNHVHMEAGLGLSPGYQQQNAQGSWHTNSKPISIYEALFLGPDVKVLNSGGYTWTKDDNKLGGIEMENLKGTLPEGLVVRQYLPKLASTDIATAVTNLQAEIQGEPKIYVRPSADGKLRLMYPAKASTSLDSIAEYLKNPDAQVCIERK